MRDRRDVERRQDHIAPEISFALDAKCLKKRMDNIPTLILRGHLSAPVQVVDAINDAVEIILAGKEVLIELFEHVPSVINHGIAGKAIKLHDSIRQLGTSRNNPRPE